MSTATMSTMEIANTLVELCKQGKNHEAITTLYSKDVVSNEAAGSPEMPQEVAGIDAVMGKGQWWVDNHLVHEASVGGPWPNGDQFIVTFKYDVTNKPSGNRFIMEEAALYTVKDGKIVREDFFYSM